MGAAGNMSNRAAAARAHARAAHARRGDGSGWRHPVQV